MTWKLYKITLAILLFTGSIIPSAIAQNWKLTGNSAVSGANFVGTTDTSNLLFRTNNLERMRISGTGNVGIGVSSPAFRLDVSGNSRFNGTLQIGNYTFPATDGIAGSTLTTNGSGNISWQPVGYSAPVATNSYIFSLQSYPGSGLYFDSTSAANAEYQFRNLSGPLGFTDKLFSIKINGGTTFIKGNLGVGRTAQTRLDIKGANGDLNSTEGDFRLGNNSYRIKMGISVSGGTAGDARIRSVGGTNRLILGSGTNDIVTLSGYKMGVGNTNPAYVIDVNGTAKFTGVLGGSGGLIVSSSGNVGINTDLPSFDLDVCGVIRAKEVRVETGWCDYVFESDYKLMPLAVLEQYINDNKHLPGIETQKNVEAEGLKVGEMTAAMMKKIEELTLYVIELKKENQALQQRIVNIENR